MNVSINLKNDSKIDLVISIVLFNPDISKLTKTIRSISSSSVGTKIVLFDNSPRKLAKDILAKWPSVTYHFNNGKNVGFGSAHNYNIKKHASLAPYFLILNPDIYFAPSLLGSMIQKMNADSSIGLSIPKICFPSGDTQRINRRVPRPQDYVINFVSQKIKSNFMWTQKFREYLLFDMDLTKPFYCPVISGCFMFFRSDTLQSINGFDERFFLYLEDTDLSRRVNEVAKSVVFSDLEAYHYWLRGGHRNLKLFFTQVSNTVRYFNKWGWVVDRKRNSLNQKVSYYVPTKKNADYNSVQ